VPEARPWLCNGRAPAPRGDGKTHARTATSSSYSLRGSPTASLASSKPGGVGAERLVELARAAVQTLEAAAGQVAGPAGSLGARDPEAMRHWLHDLRTPVTAITGWDLTARVSLDGGPFMARQIA
jgi:hypothetical protein